MDIIRSKENNKIKYVRSLNSKKSRDEENTFIVEGIKFVNEAITENAHIMYLIFSESALNKTEIKELYYFSKECPAETIICDDIVFNTVGDTINSQGVIAVIKKKKDVNAVGEYNFAIFCDRIQDPGNLGTIIRTADAFGPAVVILNKGCVDVYNSKVVRASAGAIFRVPFVHADSDEKIINSLKSLGYKIISAVVDSEHSFDDLENSKMICVVIGNEGQGVSREIVNNSHMSITIKMSGRAESLNASIAAGICIYEIRKKLL
ncbi:MAG: TrmH family RNA methyltransferase [Sedimentibacter sp.]